MNPLLKPLLRALVPTPLRHGAAVLHGKARALTWRVAPGAPWAPRKLNLGSGSQRIPGFLGVDLDGNADFRLNLETGALPFAPESMEVVVCTSAINYLTQVQAAALIRDVHRVLRPGGVARFSCQDMELLARHYVDKNDAFFNQTLPGGGPRFPGLTRADKFAGWFYGFPTAGGPCRYVYDYESLALRFNAAGFSVVERRAFCESRIPEVAQIDNRPDQMFYLEAVKGPR